MSDTHTPEIRGYAPWEVAASAVVAIAVTVVVLWWASGFGPFYESLFRVAPTIEGGGVGTDWVVGNTIPALDFAIALVHAVDVIMGVFLLFLMAIHWTAFRRFAARMTEQPATDGGAEAATDGGTVDHETPDEGGDSA